MLELKGVTKETGRSFNSFIAHTSGKWRPDAPPPPKKKNEKNFKKRLPGALVLRYLNPLLTTYRAVTKGGGQVGFSPGTAALNLIFVSRTIKICLRII